MEILVILKTLLPVINRIVPKIIAALEDGKISNDEVWQILIAALDMGADEAKEKNRR